jgi:hypothetical protein
MAATDTMQTLATNRSSSFNILRRGAARGGRWRGCLRCHCCVSSGRPYLYRPPAYAHPAASRSIRRHRQSRRRHSPPLYVSCRWHTNVPPNLHRMPLICSYCRLTHAASTTTLGTCASFVAHFCTPF